MMRKLTKKEIKEIVESHGRWLRGEKGGECANLSSAKLSGANLEGANLEGANLFCAYLYYANLYNANLEGANLCGANLYNANLEGANLCCANLYNANLEGANLCGAYIEGANLEGAKLEGAKLSGANLEGANLCCAELSKAYYQINRIGSRKRMTTYNATDDVVFCGCWNDYKGGTLEEFRKRVESVYGENGENPNKQYYAEYIAAIGFFEKMRAVLNEESRTETKKE